MPSFADLPAEQQEQALAHARVVWEYSQLPHTPIPAELILVFGTNDTRVAEHAADLYHRGFGQRLLCAGGMAHQHDMLATGWTVSEAEQFASVAVEHGVPRENILLEPQSRNTSENIRFSRALLAQTGLQPRNLLLASKPFVQRRIWATFVVEWPEMAASLSTFPMTLDEYFTPQLTPDLVINVMLGDLQRLWVYAPKGYSAPQRLPAEVQESFAELCRLGFTKHLLAEG